MVVDMSCPCPIEWNQPSTVDSPAKYVLWHEFTLVPYEELAVLCIDGMFPLTNTLKPIPIRVVMVFEPFVNKHVGGRVVQALITHNDQFPRIKGLTWTLTEHTSSLEERLGGLPIAE